MITPLATTATQRVGNAQEYKILRPSWPCIVHRALNTSNNAAAGSCRDRNFPDAEPVPVSRRRSERCTMSRFTIGDRVVISKSIFARYRNRQATVVGVHPISFSCQGAPLLATYTVRFDDGEEVQFYDTQLTRVPDTDQE